MRLPLQVTARPRLVARTLLLAFVLSSTAIAGLQSVHGPSHHAASGAAAHLSVTDASPDHGSANHDSASAAGLTSHSQPARQGATPQDHAAAGNGAVDQGTASAAGLMAHPHAAEDKAAPHDTAPAGAGSAAAAAPRDKTGAVDHTAMTIMSGQMDGPSQPTNREASTASATASAAAQSGLSPAMHWLRDSVLAVPAVLLALLLVAALSRRVRLSWRGRSTTGASQAVTVSGALALASPAHGLLFGEGVASLREVVRVFLIVLPFTSFALLAVAALAGVAGALPSVDRERLGRRSAVAALAGSVLATVVSLPATATAAPPTPGGTTAVAPAPAPVPAGAVCPSDARKVVYELSAFSISIPLNGWGDKLPNGLSYALNGRDARIGTAQMTANPNLTRGNTRHAASRRNGGRTGN